MSDQDLAGYAEETVEQIEARFSAGEGISPEIGQEPEPAPAVDPPPDPPAPTDPPSDPPPPVEVKPNGEEHPPAPEEFDERQFQIEEMRLKLEKTEADNRRIELARGRETGEIGHLRRQLAEMQAAMMRPRELDDDAEPARGRRISEPVLPGTSVDQSRLAELENDARAGAIAAEYQEFLTSRGIKPEETMGLLQKIGPAIQEQWEPYKESMGEMSPRSVRKVLRTVLDSAYADLRLRELQSQAAEARARKVSQVPEVRKAKLAASVAGSGGASPPAPRPKSSAEMSAQEADAELTRLYGRRGR